ncbi:hypothetical protein BZY99_11105 [Pectobacterium versatile]|nr:hypothetical protein BZY99_11105 [Pectobacterium versatile]
MAALLGTLACASPLWGRCKQRSNLPPAGLSLTRITYSSKFIGIPSLAAFLKLELFRVYCSLIYSSLMIVTK